MVKNLCPVLERFGWRKGKKTLDSQRQVEDDFGETISNNDIC